MSIIECLDSCNFDSLCRCENVEPKYGTQRGLSLFKLVGPATRLRGTSSGTRLDLRWRILQRKLYSQNIRRGVRGRLAAPHCGFNAIPHWCIRVPLQRHRGFVYISLL